MPDSPVTILTCGWRYSEGYWQTACDHSFEFNDGGPKENGARYCCFCGKPLQIEERPDA